MCKQPPGPTSVWWYSTSCKPGYCSPSKLTWKLHGMFKDLSMMYHASNRIIHVISDLSIMYHALWDRRHKGVTRISQCTRRITECTDVSEWYMSAYDPTMHGILCLNPIMKWIIWFWYIMKPKFGSKVPKRELVNHALYKIYVWFCGHVHSNASVTS